MVAIGILALSLVTLIRITTNNVRATLHARMLTSATFLARTRMADIEDQILEEGFVDNDQEDAGDFSDQGQSGMRWTSKIEKVELPADMAQKTQEASTKQVTDSQQIGSQNPLQAMAGFMGGFMATLIDPIRLGLENAVRRVSVTVFWNEPGKAEQSLPVVTYLTDPAKLDLAMPGVAGVGAGTAGGVNAGAPGTPGGAPGGGPSGAAASIGNPFPPMRGLGGLR